MMYKGLRGCASLTLLLLVGLSSCVSSKPEPQWVEHTVMAGTEGILWNAIEDAFDKVDLDLGTGIDLQACTARSGWRLSLSPFKGKGYREKASLEFSSAASDTEGAYDVRVRVERESNEDIVRPVDPSFAVWEPAPDGVGLARRIMQFIRSALPAEFEMQGRRDPFEQPQG